MKEQDRTKEQLINELAELRERVAELETSEAERKRAEEALKESEAKYKSLFEGSHDAILLADNETGRFVDCNRKAEELSGYSRDEILRMKIGQFTPEDIKGEIAEEFQKLIAGKGIQKKWEILTKSGNMMPVEISSTLIRIGNKPYLQGVVRDITERKQAERTLRESEERFRSSVETMLEGFAIFSAVRDDAGHIIDFRYDYINEAGCKINQRTREGQIGHNLLELLPKHKDVGLFDEYVRVVETGRALTIESLFYEGVYGGGQKLVQAIDLRAVKLGDGFATTWRDVTQRKHAEEELRQSEERLKLLVESSKDMIFMQDLEGKYLYFNSAPEHSLSIDDIMNKTPFDFFKPETAARLMNQLKQVAASGKAMTFENHVVWKGEPLWLLDHRYPIRDAKGHVVAIGTIARNITERKLHEEKLQKSESLLRAFMSAIKEAAFVVDTEGIVIIANETLAQRLGTNVNEIIGTCIYNYLPPEIARDRKSQVEKVIRTGKSLRYEDRRAGMWIDSFVYPIFDEEGKVINVGVIAVDITERKKAEEALRESEERYKRLVEGSPDIVWSFSDKRGTLYVSTRVETILGYSPDYLYKNPWLWNESIHPDDRDRICQAIKDFSAGKDLDVEYRIKDSAENWRWFHDRSIGKQVREGETITEGISTDVTERKGTEESLRRTEENFRRSLDDSPLGVRVVTEEGETIYANRAMLQIYGYDSIEELRATPVKKRYTPESYAEFQIRREKRRRGEDTPSEYEVSIVKKNGEVRDLRVHRKEIFWDGQRQFQALYFDITERKRLEETLKEEQQQLKLIIDSSPIIVFFKDKEGKFVRVNKAFSEALKMREEEFVGKTVFDLYCAETAQGMTDDDQDVLKSRNPKLNIIEQYESASGIRWVQTDKIPVYDEDCIPAGLIGFAQDITDRKRAEEALRESEEQYRTFFSNSFDAILLTAPDGRILDMNEEACRIFGYTQEELRKIGRDGVVDKSDPQLANALEERKRKVKFRGELNLIRKDGTKFPADISSAMFKDKDGNLKTSMIIRDITERKQVEEALQNNLTLYRGLIETTDTGFVILDQYGKVLDANQEYLHLSGHEDLSQILGGKVTEWTADYEKERNAEAVGKCLREGQIRNLEIDYINAQGKITPVEINATVVKVDGVPQILTLCRDITERKRIGEALKKSESLHKEAQKAAHIGHWELDTSIMVPTWSEEIFRIFGLDAQKSPPSFAAHQKVTHPDDWNILNNAMTRVINEGIPFDIDFRTLRPDKTIRWMHAIGYSKKDSEGRIVSVFGTAQDVTKSKQAEDQLKSSREQLRALSAHLQNIREEERTLIAREVHDELGQELTGLKMDLSWLVKRLSKNQKSLISKTELMLKLVDSTIRTVRRISSELRPGVLDDLGLIPAIEWQTQDFENRTGITCVFSSSPEEIDLDQDRSTAVFRIFQETMTNVSRHTNATKVKINLETGANTLILRIEDNGKGIKESEISHPKSLGLLGMRERALVFGGTVEINGIPGKGTTVTVTIPIKKE